MSKLQQNLSKLIRVINNENSNRIVTRTATTNACNTKATKKGLVLGAYTGCEPHEITLTPTAAKFDSEVGGKLKSLVASAGLDDGKARHFNLLHPDYYAVAVAGMGPENAGYSRKENIMADKENIRVAAGVGAMVLQDLGVTDIEVEPMNNAEAAAEGATLGLWRYQEHKCQMNRKNEANLHLYEQGVLETTDKEEWERGVVKGEAQNIARYLSITPANIMTPTNFAQFCTENLCPCGIEVKVRDRHWIKEKCMNAFWTIAKGSCEPPLLVELHYKGGGDSTVVMTGKGCTYDSGGLCLYKCSDLRFQHGDMAGAAAIVGVFKALCDFKLPVNVTAIIPLYENMPGGAAVKPGDVVKAMNGKTIRIERPDQDGRVVLADALAYASCFSPKLTINVATLSRSMKTAMGTSSSGVFSTSDNIWKELYCAGADSGDRVWRFPFWEHASQKVIGFNDVDNSNFPGGKGGNPLFSSAFIKEFAPPGDFVSVDISSSALKWYNSSKLSNPYLRPAHYTGRPTRMLIQFLWQIACPRDSPCPEDSK